MEKIYRGWLTITPDYLDTADVLCLASDDNQQGIPSFLPARIHTEDIAGLLIGDGEQYTHLHIPLEDGGKGEKREWSIYDTELAAEIGDDIDQYGNNLSMRYVIANTPQTPLLFHLICEGSGYARYQTYSDEWTDSDGEEHDSFDGYVEEFTIGGLNILKQLKEFEGKYLYMVIDFIEKEDKGS